MAAGSQAKRLNIFRRDNWTCQRCGKIVKSNGTKNSVSVGNSACLHHIRHRRDAGTEANHNLVTVCADCEIEYHRLLNRYESRYRRSRKSGEPLSVILEEAGLWRLKNGNVAETEQTIPVTETVKGLKKRRLRDVVTAIIRRLLKVLK